MKSDRSFREFSGEDLEQLVRSTSVASVEHHAALPSTSTRALALAGKRDLELPSLVIAERQTAGRGRGGNQWWSAPGALTCSLLLEHPGFHAAGLGPCISLTAGIAVCEALQQISPGLDAAVKWPNDVFVRRRKICGILVEVSPHRPPRIIVGIGLNVNNSLATAPQQLQARATALVDAAGYSFSLTSVLIAVLNQLATYLRLLQHDPLILQQRWETFCMLTGQQIEVLAGSQKTVGRCLGIDGEGALRLETSDGVMACRSGTVTRWGELN